MVIIGENKTILYHKKNITEL